MKSIGCAYGRLKEAAPTIGKKREMSTRYYSNRYVCRRARLAGEIHGHADNSKNATLMNTRVLEQFIIAISAQLSARIVNKNTLLGR